MKPERTFSDLKLLFDDLFIELGGDLYLRRFRHDDVDAVYETVKRNEAHLMEFMHWMTPDYSRESAEEFIGRAIDPADPAQGLGLGIYRGNAFIGSIGFVYFDLKARKTEIGYWIDRGEQGKGIVSAATAKLIEFAFDKLGMNRIEIRCSAENRRSAAIPLRFGFLQEGLMRQAELRNGRLQDFRVFGLLRSE